MGLCDWGRNSSRRSDICITVPGGERIKLGASSYNAEPTYKFAVPEAGTVLVEILATNASQSPMLNWVAVAEGDVESGGGTAAHLVVVNGDDVQADNLTGLTYKGIGAPSANSTSTLLTDFNSHPPGA